jgi:CheY-like chemotaxis protein
MTLRQPLVLLAEDNRDERDMYSTFLEMAGFQVTSVENGLAAVRTAHETRPDVIVLDMMMPILSGAEAARQLKQDPDLARVPIVGISAFPYDMFRAVSPRIGADAWVMKPCSPDELVTILHRVL